MDLERSFCSSSMASTVGEVAADEEAVATDLKDMEAAEILAAFTHSKNRDAVSVGLELASKWGCKGKRVRKRVSTSESPPSDIGLKSVDPVQSGSDLAEVGYSRRVSTGNVALVKPVKVEKKAEPVKSSPACVAKYLSGDRRRSRQNLTEAEKEERRLCRILANRESARQTIRRRQALCENLTLKVADLTRENENLKRAKELALKEYLSQESTNKNLKAEMAKAVKADKVEAPGEVKLAHQISGPSRNHPFLFYNERPFAPFWWPSIVQSQCGQQNALFVSSSISPPTYGMLDSSHDRENPGNVNGPNSPLYVVPYPWFFSLPDHGNGLHPHPSGGLNNIKDEATVNNGLHPSLPIEDEKEAYGSLEASSNNMNCTPVRSPPDGGGQCIRFHVKEEVLALTPPCSAGTTFVEELDIKPDHVINTETSPIRACHIKGALPEQNRESINSMSKEVQEAVTAAEARRRRKEFIKLKHLQGRQCQVQQ